MREAIKYRLWLVCMLILFAGCRDQPRGAERAQVPDATCPAAARVAAEQLGERMRLVSLLAPDSIVVRAIADAYAPLVTTRLLTTWQSTPASAPGREVSNPWPARIEIRSMEAQGDECRVEGDVVYVTTADTISPVERRSVTLRLREETGWRVRAYEMAAADTTNDAADVVRRYYDAIQAGDYGAAHALWADSGRASGQTRREFAAGFSPTAQVRVTVGDSVRVEGAAGSQYATVPVAINAVLRNGQQQRFEGTYTLRRAVVDGATPEQRRWRIHSADVRLR